MSTEPSAVRNEFLTSVAFSTSPNVTVLMSVHNGERYLREAVESILVQSFDDFEFLIIDDCSTDASRTILAEYEKRDSRIIVVENEQNVGLSQSLNRGLSLACGKYIVRMDADDISLPERLQKQVAYMESHPLVGVLGTNIIYIDERGIPTASGRPKDRQPESARVIKWLLLWRNCIYHPTVILRRYVLESENLKYNPLYTYSQDRELWTRLVKYTTITKLPQVLVKYRITSDSISRARRQEQLKASNAITQRELSSLLGQHVSEQVVRLCSFCAEDRLQTLNVQDFVSASDTLIQAYQRFCDSPLTKHDRAQIKSDVARRLAYIAVQASRYSRRSVYIVLWKMWRLSTASCLSLSICQEIAKALTGMPRR